jgi:internalin A
LESSIHGGVIIKKSATPFLESTIKNIGRLQQLDSLTIYNCFFDSLPDNYFDYLTNLKSLRIYGNLTHIPGSIAHCSELKSLTLSGNELTEFPESITKCALLEEVILSNNHIQSIPPSIAEWSHLKRLDLSSNELTQFPAQFNAPDSLTNVSLANNNLTAIPQFLCRTNNVRTLDLQRNKISLVPPSLISSCQSLSDLSLSNNPIGALPESIGELSHLKKIFFDNCGLSEIPESVRQCDSLRYVFLDNNSLTEFPTVLLNLDNDNYRAQISLDSNNIITLPLEIMSSKLQSIDIDRNMLCKLPDSLINWLDRKCYSDWRTTQRCPQNLSDSAVISSLEGLFSQNANSSKHWVVWAQGRVIKLNLSNLDLRNVPAGIGNLSQLQTLDLSVNLLSELPEELANCTLLKTLDISNNHNFEEIPSIVLEYRNLTALDVSGNGITQIPNEIGNLKRLRYLSLRGNKISELPKSLTQLDSLDSLDLGFNRLTSASFPVGLGNLKNLEWLNLVNNAINSTDMLNGCHQINTLYLNANELESLDAPLFDSLPNLAYLWANNNKIQYISDAIGHSIYLKRLFVSGNQLHTIPDSICNIRWLFYLDISKNYLDSLPTNIGQLNLDELVADHNRIRNLPQSILQLSRTELSLDFNRLCDIPNEFAEWVTKYNPTMASTQICPLPDSLLSLVSTLLAECGHPEADPVARAYRLGEDSYVLRLDSLGITSLPQSFALCTAFTEIHLENNFLTSLPASLTALPNLRQLYLYNNRLESLPESMGDLTNLTQLFCDENSIRELPVSLGTIPGLQILGVRFNALCNVSEETKNLLDAHDEYWINYQTCNSEGQSKKDCGCGAGAALAFVPPIGLRARRFVRRKGNSIFRKIVARIKKSDRFSS